MNNNQIERMVFEKTCKYCSCRQECAETKKTCKVYNNEIAEALSQMGENYESAE